jgi:hypothetical protein
MFLGTHLVGFGVGGGIVPGQVIDRTAGTNIGNMTDGGGLAAAFDGNTSVADDGNAKSTTANDGYCGKTLASASTISKAEIYSSSNLGHDTTGGATTITITLYGKQGSAPGSATDGTSLGSDSFSDTVGMRTINSSDAATLWDHVWVRVQTSGGGVIPYCGELVLYT